MKKIKVSKMWKIALAFAISISAVGTLVSTTDLLATEEFDVKETVTVNEDETQATITLDVVNINENYTIQSIQNPDGSMMDMVSEPSYIVNANGTYKFLVNYRNNSSEADEDDLELLKEVQVSGINKTTEEVEGDNTTQEDGGLNVLLPRQPRTVTSPSGDSLTVQFNKTGSTPIDWSSVGIYNWNFYDTEQIEISATFANQGTTKDRTIEIEIPDGYELLAYSAKDGTVSQSGEQILTTTTSTQQAMVSSSLTATDGNAFGSKLWGSFSNISGGTTTAYYKGGKITYKFNSNTDTVVLTLNVGIQKGTYDYNSGSTLYSDINETSSSVSTGQLKDEMTVEMTSGSESLSEEVQANVVGNYTLTYLHRGFTLDNVDSTYINSGSNSSPEISPYGPVAGADLRSGIYRSNSIASTETLAEEIIVVYTYPEGATYNGLANSVMNSSFENEVHDPISRTITVTYKNSYFVSDNGYATLRQPKFTLSGTKYGTDSGKSTTARFLVSAYVKYSNSDGYRKITPYQSDGFNVSILDEDEDLVVVGFDSKSYDYTEAGFDGYYNLGGYRVTNPSFKEKTDVALEWEINGDLGVKIARLAVPKNSTLSNIKVYTTTNSTGYDVANMVSASSSTGVVLDGDVIGLGPNEYITKITGTINKYTAQLTSSSDLGYPQAYYISGYQLYGVFQNNSGGSHTLTIDGISDTVNTSPTTDRLISIMQVDETTSLETSYLPGDTIPIGLQVEAGNATYDRDKVTDNYLQDPTVYVRVPEGFNLDESSMKLMVGTTDVTAKATLKSKSVAGDGSTIYKYTFDEPYTVMAGLHTKGNSISYTVNQKFNVYFELNVSPSNQGVANLKLQDIIFIEGKANFKNAEYAKSQIISDTYGLTTSGQNLISGSATASFSVVKLPELQVYSGIKISGSAEDFYQYNGTDSTVASLSQDYNATVELSYKNNAPNSFDNADIYFPIPKAGADYGKYFNNKAISDPLNNVDSSPFTWNANLVSDISAPGFNTLYAIDGSVNSTDFDSNLTWEAFIPATQWYTYTQLTAAGKNLSDVIFVKFESTGVIASGAEGSFTFELSAASGSPVDEINYWRPFTGAEATGSGKNSWSVGSVLAGSLSVGKLGIKPFIDTNGNGKYDSGESYYTGSDLTIMISEKDGKTPTQVLPYNATEAKYYLEMLKQGTYTISILNNNPSAYHFSTTTTSTSGQLASDPVFNTTHTEAKIENIIIDSQNVFEYTDFGVGLVEAQPVTFEFESNVKADGTTFASSTITLNGQTANYNTSFVYGTTFPKETYGVEPTVSIPSGYVHTGWQIYVDDGSGAVKQGDVIAKGNLKDTVVKKAASGDTVIIRAVIAFPPTVTIDPTKNPLEGSVGDVANVLDGVSVSDPATGLPIPLNPLPGASQNVVIAYPTDMIDSSGNYKTEGSYEVTLTITNPSTGSEVEVKREVLVHGLPTITATGQEYLLGSSGILTGVAGNPTATWNKAVLPVGSTTVPTAISGPAVTTAANNKISYEVLSGPSSTTDFSKVGVYKVKYTATNPQGKTVSKTVEVLITKTLPDSNDIAISADNLVLKQNELTSLTADKLKDANHGNASAFYKTTDNDGEITYKDITSNVTVSSSDVNKLKNVGSEGGIEQIEFTVTEDGKTSAKQVTVVIEGTQTGVIPTPDGDTLALTAEGFTIENNEAAGLDSTVSVTKSTATALLVKAGTPITNITAKASDLTAIQAAPKSGGVYNLTLTAEDQGETVSVTVKVVVKGTSTPDPKPTPDGDVLAISAQGFTITNLQAKVLTDGSAITNANASAWLVNAGTSVTGITVNQTQLTAIHNVSVSGGIYDLTYTATSQGVTTSTTVKVVVKGITTPDPKPTPDGDSLAITATGFTLENAAAASLDTTAAITSGKASAYLVNAGTNITDLSVDATQLAAINAASKEGGIFDLTYTAKDQGVEISTTVKVVVKGTTTPDPKPTPDGDTLAITAKGFILENSEAAGFDSDGAKTKSDVKSWLVNAKTAITNITVKASDVANINNAPISGGIYDVVFTATDQGVNISSTVKAVVKGTSTPDPVPTPDGDKIAITAKGFTLENSEASALSDATAITKGGAKAYLVTSGTEVTNITVDATQLAAIQNANKGGGIYDLTYSAEDQGITITTTVKVVVKGISTPDPKPTPDGDKLAITADGFTLENVDAAGLDETTAITKGNAQAYLIDAGTSVTNITVKTSDLTKVNNAPTSGGIYDLTYTAQDQGITISTTVKVVVKGTSTPDPKPTPDGDTLSISAKGFTLENADASKLTSSSAVTNADAQAWLVNAGVSITDIKVDATQLTAIQKAPAGGGIYNLTYTAEDQGVSISTTVKVVVKGTNTPDPEPTPDGDTLAISASGFTIENTDALALNEADAIIKGNATAVLVDAGTAVTNITVTTSELDAINAVGKDGGIYDLTYTAQDQGVEISTTVKVVVRGTNTPDPKPTPDGDELSISAKGFTLENADAAPLSEADAITLGKAKAYLLKSGNEVTNITVDKTELTAIQSVSEAGGIYDLTYTAEDQGVTISTTVKVVVKGTATPDPEPTPDGQLVFTAKGFVLTNDAAKTIDEAGVITESKAVSMILETGEEVGTITVKADDLATINGIGEAGGVVPTTLTTTYVDSDGDIHTIDVTVNVVIQGKTTIVEPTPDGNSLVVTGGGFTQTTKEAKELTEKAAIKNGNVEALIAETGEEVTDIKVDKDQLAAINNTNSDGGIFDLTYTVTYVGPDGNTTTAKLTVVVLVTPDGGVVDPTGTVVIDAKSFSLENTDASKVDQAKAITLGKAIAYEVIRDSNNVIVRIDTITANVTVNAADLKEIQGASIQGGLYDLEFSVTNKAAITVAKDVTVFVKPLYSSVDDDEVITLGATGFEISYKDAASLNSTKSIEKAYTSAIKQLMNADGNIVGYEDITSKITVNSEELDAIQKATSNGGIFPLTFTVVDNDVTVEKTVMVVVTGDGTPPVVELPNGDALSITAHDFTITNAEAAPLSSDLAIQLAEAKAMLINSQLPVEVSVNAEELEAITKAPAKGGVYDLTFIATYTLEDGSTYTTQVTIKVTVLAKGEQPSVAPSGSNTTNGTSVDTGDMNNKELYIMMASLAGLYIVLKRRKRA
ncbi:beta strand repeat-containing protein [Breznakia pachnodae]|uniref:Uncharacterized protein n=1 Tax=Breznakia pachnodae TaxID=265178 RepID=A0ABU0E1D5_9FIRM|nr:hypothetical protein [Breznakia pachnodae]MDQ0360684.1 hypothetical protein [Breznakia pachnodae]